MPSLGLGLFARFSEYFSGRTNGKLEIYGVLDGFPDQYRSVDPLEGCLLYTSPNPRD